MIVIVNSPAFLGVAEVAAALAARFEAGAELDLHALLARTNVDGGGGRAPWEGEGTLEQRLYRAAHAEVARHKNAGRPDVAIGYAFHEPEPLARFRRRLAELDEVIYSFRPVYDPEALARAHDDGDVEQLSDLLALNDQWVAATGAGALRGDMGFPIAVEGCGAEQAAVAIWDDIHAPVELVAPDPVWPARFSAERERIAAVLGPLARRIEHIGSTAAPELVAKPILDIMVSVDRLEEDAVACIPPLAGLGYVFVDYPQNTERRFFRKGKPRSHHVQIVEQGGEAERAYLGFRDALRADPALRAEYAALKRAARAELSRERAGYGERKGVLVRRVVGQLPSL